MHLKSILNRVEPLKSFVYESERFVEVAGSQPFIEVTIKPRATARPSALGAGRGDLGTTGVRLDGSSMSRFGTSQSSSSM